ncbi:MAG: CoA transferase [Dehalococcoidia bacterium]
MPLPLSDIRVVDFCTVYAGPFTAMLMADQGAEVIKIEPPDGDSARTMTLVDSTDVSLSFLTFNRNKRSVTLDITTPAGKEAAYRLCQWADVLIINTRVDARKRRGFAYEDLAAINPRLIYVSLTGYGDEGPEANLPGIDIVIQARVGDIASRREPGSPPPRHTPLFHFDMSTSLATSFAVMLALREREQTGVGQKIETSLLQTALSLHSLQMTRVAGVAARGAVRMEGPRAAYLCADGRYVLNTTINIRRGWDTLCDTFPLVELVGDPRFLTPEGRLDHTAEIEEILARQFLTKPAKEWEALFKAAGHTASVVNEIDDIFNDPQVIANDMVTTFEQPGLGMTEAVGRPFRLSGSAALPWYRRPAPHLGEHTEEVLLEMGYNESDVAAMRASGALGRVPNLGDA